MINPSAEAAQLDAADPLSGLRARFALPTGPDGGPAVYLCGNSLGPMPVGATDEVAEVLQRWGRLGVRAHHEGTHPWLDYHRRFSASLARLVGAMPNEVVAMNSLTVNLHLLLASFYRPTAQRDRILMEVGAFPSDRHAVVSQLVWHGRDPAASLMEIEPREPLGRWQTSDFVDAITAAGNRLALVLLPGVQYRNGQVFDIRAITAAAHRVGAVVGFDLAHAVGNVPLTLHDDGADFAVWCHYKYVSAGPGAVGGAYVHSRHADRAEVPRLAGWWGHDPATRFAMGPEFRAMPGAEGWQVSNPPILSLAPLAAALAIFDDVGMPRLREKSNALDAFARRLIHARCGNRIDILTPEAQTERGCQLSLRVTAGRDRGRLTFERLESLGVIGDWREPDVIRIAPMPLYTSFADVDLAVRHLATALEGA